MDGKNRLTCMIFGRKIPLWKYEFSQGIILWKPQTAIISERIDRCKKTLSTSLVGGMGMMFIGTLVFNLIPGQMLRVFTSDPQVITIGMVGFHFVGISFIPMVTSLIFPVFFQAVGAAVKSSLLTVVRTVVLFVPLGYLFSRLGLNDFWFTFPVTEVITTLVGVFFYRRFMAQQK